jgi:hypothetical protein
MTKPANKAIIYVHISTELRDRAKAVGQRIRRTTAELIRVSLEEKVDALELRFAKVDEAAEKNDTLTNNKFTRPKYTLDPLAPVNSIEPLDGFTPAAAKKDENLTAIYDKFAQAIIIAANQGNVKEVEYRGTACIAAIRKERPLTCPPEATIIETLEQRIIDLRALGVGAPKRTMKAFANAIVAAVTPAASTTTPIAAAPTTGMTTASSHDIPPTVVGPALAHVPGTVVAPAAAIIDPVQVQTVGDIDIGGETGDSE